MIKTLFHQDGWLSEWLPRRGQAAENAVHAIPADSVLNTPEPDLVESVYDQFAVRPLRLGTAYTSGPQDVQVDVGGQFLRGTDGRRGVYIPGTRVEVRVPYTGDPDLWDLRASQATTLHPDGEIRGTELVLLFDEPADTLQPETFRSRIQSLLTNIERYVGFAATDCEQFNSELRPRLAAAVTARKQKVLTDRKITEFLPVDVRPRASTDPAIAVALPQRRKPPVAPVSSTVPYVPEPAISAEQYAGILQAIRDWGLAVERLPETFGPLPEEALRDNLLASLNGQFGVSGAEWFSRKGKTDILIQQADGAVFIAECKFWDGPSAFGDAIDQLLGYLVWRDTKSALVLFVRDGDVTSIIQKANDAIKRHPRYKRTQASGSIYVLRQEQDANREIEVAVVVVPVPESKVAATAGKPAGNGRRRPMKGGRL